MSAAVGPHGFEVVRGRGYRPDQVDRRVAGLGADRDSCRQREHRLKEQVRELTEELERIQAYIAQMPPQTYESLGGKARLILTSSEEAAAHLLATTEGEAEREREAAAEYGRGLDEAAQAFSQETRAAAEDAGRRTVEAARARGRALYDEAEKDAADVRGEAEAALQEMRRRTAAMLQDLEDDHAERWDADGRELAGQSAEMDQYVADLEERGETVLAEVKRFYVEMEEAARHAQEDAEARAAALISQAELEARRIEHATARTVREHDERREELRSHMAHVRQSLAALTGQTPVDEDPAPGDAAGEVSAADRAPSAAADTDSTSDTGTGTN